VVGGILPSIAEMTLFHLTPFQWGTLHLLYLQRLWRADLCEKMKNYFRKFLCEALADAVALCLFNVPVYFVCATIAGANQTQLVYCVGVQIFSNILFGRIYGFVLDLIKNVPCLKFLRSQAE
jgi:hypothetical protein